MYPIILGLLGKVTKRYSFCYKISLWPAGMSTTKFIGRHLILGLRGPLTSATTPRRPRPPRWGCGGILLPAPQATYSQERKKTMTQLAALAQKAYLLVFSKCLGKLQRQLWTGSLFLMIKTIAIDGKVDLYSKKDLPCYSFWNNV